MDPLLVPEESFLVILSEHLSFALLTLGSWNVLASSLCDPFKLCPMDCLFPIKLKQKKRVSKSVTVIMKDHGFFNSA